MPEPPDEVVHLQRARDTLRAHHDEIVVQQQALSRELSEVEAAMRGVSDALEALGHGGAPEIVTTAKTYKIKNFRASSGDRAPKQWISTGPKKMLTTSNAFDTSSEKKVPSTREAVLKLLAAAKRPLKTSEIIEGIADYGVEAEPTTTRSVVSKLASNNIIEKVERGVYQLPDDTAQLARDSLLQRTWLLTDQEIPDDTHTPVDEPADDAPEAPPDRTQEDYTQWNQEAMEEYETAHGESHRE